MKLSIKYSHPSVPMLNINIHKTYEVEIKNDKSYINIDGENIEIQTELLKILFSPIDGTWEDKQEKKNKEISNEK